MFCSLFTSECVSYSRIQGSREVLLCIDNVLEHNDLEPDNFLDCLKLYCFRSQVIRDILVVSTCVTLSASRDITECSAACLPVSVCSSCIQGSRQCT